MGDAEESKKKKKKGSRKASKCEDPGESAKVVSEPSEITPVVQDEGIPPQESEEDNKAPSEISDKDSLEKKSLAATLLDEILNEGPAALPDENLPYEVPIAVKAGDINALRDLDERKLIELKEAFNLFDLNGDGLIDAEDLKSTYVTLGQEISDDQVSLMLSEAIDPLDFDAFVVLLGYKTIELDPEEVLLEALSKWDKNRTGLISHDRIKHDLMKFGDRFSFSEAESALDEAPIAKGTGPGFNCHGPPMIDYPAFCKIIGGFRKRMKTKAMESGLCLDEIRIYPHLKNTIITDTTPYEDVICAANATSYFTSNTTSQSSRMADVKKKPKLVEGNIFHLLLLKKAIFSSDSVMAIQIFHHNISSFSSENFSISGKFRYISKEIYRTTGNLLSTTYCDYQFLPHSTSFVKENKYENAMFRNFYSPRFPAKYPSHVKCLYKFIGRPQNRIEIIFDGIILQRDNRSCINHLDKITVYDSKTLNKSTTIDVFCDVKWNKRILSTGPYLLIEFETSSNYTSHGFSAKYRFIELEEKINVLNNHNHLRTTVQPVAFTVENQVIINQHKSHSNIQSYGSNCDVVLSSSVSPQKGTIQSPLYLGSYSSKTVCRYEFHGKDHERIQINFSEFNFPPRKGKDCGEEDIIQVFEPIGANYELIDVLCGGITPKPIMSRGPAMLLVFHGTHISNKNKGFKAEYAFLTNFGITTGHQLSDYPCSFSYNSTNNKSGWFHSPNFPGNYPRDIACYYYFYGAPTERVAIRFTYFDIEGIYPCQIDSASDYLEFSNFETKDRKYTRFCGQMKGFTIKSDGKFFTILFKSNDLLDSSGFKGFYIFETDKVTTEPSSEVGSAGLRSGFNLVLGIFGYFSAMNIRYVL